VRRNSLRKKETGRTELLKRKSRSTKRLIEQGGREGQKKGGPKTRRGEKSAKRKGNYRQTRRHFGGTAGMGRAASAKRSSWGKSTESSPGGQSSPKKKEKKNKRGRTDTWC